MRPYRFILTFHSTERTTSCIPHAIGPNFGPVKRDEAVEQRAPLHGNQPRPADLTAACRCLAPATPTRTLHVTATVTNTGTTDFSCPFFSSPCPGT